MHLLTSVEQNSRRLIHHQLFQTIDCELSITQTIPFIFTNEGALRWCFHRCLSFWLGRGRVGMVFRSLEWSHVRHPLHMGLHMGQPVIFTGVLFKLISWGPSRSIPLVLTPSGCNPKHYLLISGWYSSSWNAVLCVSFFTHQSFHCRDASLNTGVSPKERVYLFLWNFFIIFEIHTSTEISLIKGNTLVKNHNKNAFL